MDLSTTPAMPPPDGQTPQFDAPYNSLQIRTVVAFGVTYFFASFFLALRYFQAAKLVKQVEIDLIILTLAYGLSLYYFITLVNLMSHGWEKHLWDVSLAQIMEFNKELLPNTLTYLITPSITKMAMLAVLFRINPSLIYRCVVVSAAVAILAYTLTLTSITGGPCNPLKSGTTSCLENVALAQAVMNIVSDFAVIAIPIPTIHRLNFTLKQKLSVGCILAIGSGVVVCSIARLPYVLILDKTTDVTYTEAILAVKYLPQLGFFSSNKHESETHDSRRKCLHKDGDNAQRSYQLHNVRNERVESGFDSGTSDVYRSGPRSRDSDNGSTDKILG
ncbi:hypothetical protein M431DRAFT_549988 [Trichoderma harzianum CBS 226.95]|uniref:Rhodopsin domain-containing protein n=1 Tax=Trichoderma harzianum CBS 226.95 TaxID=983964 RepID=A0A2T3ZSB0_TRIHA|nr:hypothetical protein M431DRAFT_549988 [Trichoderma harzianum CBS 226.95]PTB47655.1 hypothetical protein M431DRAFT_549988 [Trichoderma harzianum CBS 226.95]